MISLIVATRHPAQEVTQRFESMVAPATGVAAATSPLELIVVEDQGRGVSWARNQGIAQARDEWVLIIDDDDRLPPQAVERIVALADTARPEIGMIEWGYRIVDHDGQEIQEVQLISPSSDNLTLSGDSLIEAFVDNQLFTSNVWNKLIRRSLVADVPFHEDMAYGEDWEWLSRVAVSLADNAHDGLREMLVVADVLYEYVRHSGQVSAGFRPSKLTLVKAWREVFDTLRPRYPHLLSRLNATAARHFAIVLNDARLAGISRSVTAPLRRELRRHLACLWRSGKSSLKMKCAALWLSI